MNGIEYTQVDDAHVAYRVMGEPGRIDVVMVAGALFPLELLAEDRVAARFMAGLADLGRLVVFDRRGVGLSDPITNWALGAQVQWADDLLAVVDAAGLVDPVVVSWEPYGTARLAVSRRLGRFSAMVLVNPAESLDIVRRTIVATDGPTVPNRAVEERVFPSRIADDDFVAWLARSGRSGASPAAAARIWGHLLSYEEPLTPPGITTPTLILHRRDSVQSEVGSRAVTDQIVGAKMVQLEGADLYPVSGSVDDLIDEIAEFVTGRPSRLTPLRQIAVMLFTDLVASTQRAVNEGDERWRRLLDVHDQVVRSCVRVHGGRVVKYTGDGVLALMGSVSGALDAVQSVRQRIAEQDLLIRAGIHVGDLDIRGDDVSGVAVNVAARIMNHAAPDETLVSEGARHSALGSRHQFEAAGESELKGVPGRWFLYRARV